MTHFLAQEKSPIVSPPLELNYKKEPTDNPDFDTSSEIQENGISIGKRLFG